MKPFEKKNLFLTYPRFKSFIKDEDRTMAKELEAVHKELQLTCEAIGVEIVKYIVAHEYHKDKPNDGVILSNYHYHVYL